MTSEPGELPTYRTRSTSTSSMEFDPIKLEKREPPTRERSRKLLIATGVRNPHDERQSVSVRLTYQRRRNQADASEGEEYEGLRRIRLSDLEAGEEVSIDLDTAQTAQLLEHLQNLYAIAAEGIEWGVAEKVVLPAPGSGLAGQIMAALEASPDNRAFLLAAIRDRDPSAFDVAAHQARYARHQKALSEFMGHLSEDDWNESDWEAFFKVNRWIFGHGLAYQFLSEIQEQPRYGNEAVTGRGQQKGDHLMATTGANRFTVLVEVKTPGAELVQSAGYRNGVHAAGKDVQGGVSQLQVNIRTWEVDGSQREANRHLEDDGVFTVAPRGILVVGNLASLDSRAKRNSFELFRRNLHNPEIITFDELFERARFIVEHELKESALGDGGV